MKNLQELSLREKSMLNGGNFGGTAGVVADENGNSCTDHGTPQIKIGYGTRPSLQ